MNLLLLSSFSSAGGEGGETRHSYASIEKMIKNWISNAFTSTTEVIKQGGEAWLARHASPCTRQVPGSSRGVGLLLWSGQDFICVCLNRLVVTHAVLLYSSPYPEAFPQGHLCLPCVLCSTCMRCSQDKWWLGWGDYRLSRSYG